MYNYQIDTILPFSWFYQCKAFSTKMTSTHDRMISSSVMTSSPTSSEGNACCALKQCNHQILYIHSPVGGKQNLSCCVKASSSAFLALSLGFTILGEICAYVAVFNLTIEAVTFRLYGLCMRGVFLLLAFTCLAHECQDLLSLCDRMHVRTA